MSYKGYIEGYKYEILNNLPKLTNIEVTSQSINTYRNLCNLKFKSESDDIIENRLIRNLSFSKVVEKDENDFVLGYWDIKMLIRDNKLVSLWRDKKTIIEIDENLLDLWNIVYGIPIHKVDRDRINKRNKCA